MKDRIDFGNVGVDRYHVLPVSLCSDRTAIGGPISQSPSLNVAPSSRRVASAATEPRAEFFAVTIDNLNTRQAHHHAYLRLAACWALIEVCSLRGPSVLNILE